MMRMPEAASASMLAIHASMDFLAPAPRRFTSSGMGMDSTTVQASGARVLASTIAFRSSTSRVVHASPMGTWCKAVTISLAPAWRTSSRLTGSSGPYQRQPSRIVPLLDYRPSRRRQHHLDALRAVEGEAKGVGRAGQRALGGDELQHVNLAGDDQPDGIMKFLAEAEGALEVELLGHDGIGRHRDLPAGEVADLHDRAAAADAGDRRGETGGGAGNLEGHVEGAVRGEPLQPVLAAGDVDDVVGAKAAGEGERRRGDVNDRHFGSACQLSGEHGEEPDRPGAEQHGFFAIHIAGAGDG